jgi:hypothetical protein
MDAVCVYAAHTVWTQHHTATCKQNCTPQASQQRSITRCSHIVADTQAMPSIFFLNPLAPNQALRTTCPAHQLGLSLNAPLLNMPAGYLALLLSQCACPHSNNKLGHISTIVNSHTTSTIILQALSQASHSDVHRH